MKNHLFERKCEAGVCKELLTYRVIVESCNGCGLVQENVHQKQ